MSGVIPDSIATVTTYWGATSTLRFPVRVKITAIAFSSDTDWINPGEGWALEVTKYRRAADWADTGDFVTANVCDPSPFLGVNETYNLSTVCIPLDKGTWSDDLVRDIAQMDPDEWLAFSYYQPGVGGGPDSDHRATITVAYTGATNLD
jgi:hypothetical protein